jgi:MFS family permease
MIHLPPAFRHRRFSLLWTGLLISMAGTQMQLSALHWQIRALSDEPNPIALGGIGLARILPVIVFSLIGGAVADSLNRRKVMFVTQSGMALVALALAALTFRGSIQIWQIYLLTALQAVAAAFDLPARQAIVPNLVPAGDLPNAFSLTSIAFNTGAILGPALSGIVIASLGLGYAYLINAFSFLGVLLALAAIGRVPQGRIPGQKPVVSLSAIQEGWRFILHRPIILSTMLIDFFATFFSTANTMMPIVARDILHVGEIGYGLLSSAQSIGAVSAALVASQLKAIQRQGRVFLSAVGVFGLSTILFGLANSFWLAMLALIGMGAADSISTIIRNTIRQLNTPDYLRGRMTSINQIFFMGGPQFGEVEAGIVAQLFGVPFAIISGGVGCLLAVAWVSKRWPQIRTYQGDEPALAATPAD